MDQEEVKNDKMKLFPLILPSTMKKISVYTRRYTEAITQHNQVKMHGTSLRVMDEIILNTATLSECKLQRNFVGMSSLAL